MVNRAKVEVRESPDPVVDKPMGFHKTVGPHRVAAQDLEVPELFTRWASFAGQGRQVQFTYLAERMTELAQAGALSVTQVHQQPVPIPDYCGMIIFGREFAEASNEIRPAMIPLDAALRDYLVKVESVVRDTSKILGNDKKTPKEGVPVRVPLGWKVGKQSAGSIRSRASQHHKGFVADSRMVDVYVESDLFEAEIPIVDAWRMLHQHGEHCINAPTPSRRARMWLYREIIPEAAKNPPAENPGFSNSPGDAPHMRRRVG